MLLLHSQKENHLLKLLNFVLLTMISVIPKSDVKWNADSKNIKDLNGPL